MPLAREIPVRYLADTCWLACTGAKSRACRLPLSFSGTDTWFSARKRGFKSRQGYAAVDKLVQSLGLHPRVLRVQVPPTLPSVLR